MQVVLEVAPGSEIADKARIVKSSDEKRRERKNFFMNGISRHTRLVLKGEEWCSVTGLGEYVVSLLCSDEQFLCPNSLFLLVLVTHSSNLLVVVMVTKAH